MQHLHSESKVVQLYNAKHSERDEYVNEVKRLSDELIRLSQQYGESTRSTLADLTYIVIGRDIMDAIEAGYEEASGAGRRGGLGV